MAIKTVKAMRNFLVKNSGFQGQTVDAVIEALGYSLKGTDNEFRELSDEFENCAENGADCGFGGFIYYNETIPFFITNRRDIVMHMINMAEGIGTDIISMVQGFGVFRHGGKPTAGEVGRALYDSGKTWPELATLHNVFAWYTLEEVSRTWYRYLEDNTICTRQGVDEQCFTL